MNNDTPARPSEAPSNRSAKEEARATFCPFSAGKMTCQTINCQLWDSYYQRCGFWNLADISASLARLAS